MGFNSAFKALMFIGYRGVKQPVITHTISCQC